MNILNSWLSRRFFVKASLLYMGLLLVIGLSQPHNLPSLPILCMQFLYISLAVVFSQFYSTISLKQTLFCIFVFQVICGLGLRYFNYEYFHDPLGFEPIDAASYDDFGRMVIQNSYQNLSFLYLKRDTSIDDLGFPGIIYFVYRFFGRYGREVLVVMNAGIVTWGSYILYLTLLRVDRRKSTFIAFFWGIEAFAVCTAANGLKENFFAFFMTAAMYYLCKVYTNFSARNILFFFLSASGVLLFRIALFYAFLFSFILLLFLKFRFVKRYIWLLAILALVVAFLIGNSVLNSMLELRGSSYEMITNAQIQKGSTLLSWITNFAAALVGPFPSFVADAEKRNYITLWSFTPFCKMLYSLFFLYGTYYAIKVKKVEYFPFILMWAMNTLMITIMFFALHDRFQWPHIPFTLILSCLGYDALSKARNRKYLQYIYLIWVIAMILLYNFRI